MLLALIFLLTAAIWPASVSAAGGDVVDCTLAYNISRSEGYGSADPFLVADPAGRVHLFWAERVRGEPNAIPNVPDAVMYTVWDGQSWSTPIDIFLSPQDFFNRRIAAIRAVIDDERILHLLWQGPDNTLYYSSGPADKASSSRAWQEPVLLANDEVGTQFSAYLAYEAPSTLHIIYGKGTSNTENRSVVYIRSDDRGDTWSEPVELYRSLSVGRGSSNARLLVDAPHLYATWTEWDLTGNGQAVYFARSVDRGRSWQAPLVLDERQGQEYERDWTTLALLGENELVAFWEGGWRAYRQAQYSRDGGETWSEPIDTLDWLIADNGFAEFARDSAGRLHLFVFQRVREGNLDKGDQSGLWHTLWEGGTEWREPALVGEPAPGNLVSIAISGGNQLFAASTSTVDYEIWVRRCSIEGAPRVEPQTERAVTPVVGLAGPESSKPTVVPVTPTPQVALTGVVASPASPHRSMLLGISGPFLLVAATMLWYVYRRRQP